MFGNDPPPVGDIIANNTFIQFEDVSAKFEASAFVSGSLDLAGAATIGVENGSISLALGLGLEESSEKIYFKDMASTLIALRQTQWRKVGVIDVSLPVSLAFDIASDGLKDVLNNIELTPIISITDAFLFGPEAPKFSIDFDIE